MNVNKFFKIAESLRQYRRAELKEFQDELGGNPLDILYVDPLPSDAILNSVLSSTSTFLLGRKGTGKSTVFARAQSELRKDPSIISIYIDVKTLNDVARATEIPIQEDDLGVDPGVYTEHLLRKTFLGDVLAELVRELDNRVEEMSLWDRWQGKKKSLEQVRTRLEVLRSSVKVSGLTEQELPVLRKIATKAKIQTTHQQGSDTAVSVGGSASATDVKIGGKLAHSRFDKTLDDAETYNEYSEVVLRSLPFHDLITEIQDLLDESGLKRVVVFFDDFSELDYLDQKLFVDVVLAPLNNSSNDRIKLKVAGYPGRVYYGKIDPSKVDTVQLDFSALYEDIEVQGMETSAQDYTKRLLETRFEAFGEKMEDYFESQSPPFDYYELLFQSTFNVPRLIGSLLHTCYLDRVSKGLQITPGAIRLAARKYYETVVDQYFDRMNKWAIEPYEAKLDRHNQKSLLQLIVETSRELRASIRKGTVGGAYFKELSSIPTSHFIVNSSIDDVFQSLESNFILSRYKDTRDKDGKPVTVFALHYGLTELERLSWGYPPGRQYRNYFVQRCFDFTPIVHDFLSKNQTIRCDNCFKNFPMEHLDSIQLYEMRCPSCDDGVCEIVILAEDFEDEVRQLKTELMVEPIELDILNTLNEEDRSMRAGEISSLIDVTYQLVGRRTSKLQDLGYVDKAPGEDGRMRSAITTRSQEIHFDRPHSED